MKNWARRKEQLTKAAYASYSDDTGSLEVGKRFDAVIWDEDLFRVADDELLQVRVKATIIDGQVAFGELKP
jgi:predicted amidohydrolase YtcJ